jgi:hypothetical protein
MKLNLAELSLIRDAVGRVGLKEKSPAKLERIGVVLEKLRLEIEQRRKK